MTTQYTQAQLTTQRRVAQILLAGENQRFDRLDQIKDSAVQAAHRQTIVWAIEHYQAKIARLDEQIRPD